MRTDITESMVDITSHDATPILEITDVARIYRIPRQTQWKLRKSGKLPYRQVPGSTRVYYTPEDLAEFLDSIRHGGQRAA